MRQMRNSSSLPASPIPIKGRPNLINQEPIDLKATPAQMP